MHRTPSIFPSSRLALLLAIGLALGACDSTSNPFADDAPTMDEILSAGWLMGDDDTSASKAGAPVYCYGTIGKEDCYDRPLPDEGGRLVGYEGPPPPSRDDI